MGYELIDVIINSQRPCGDSNHSARGKRGAEAEVAFTDKISAFSQFRILNKSSNLLLTIATAKKS